MKKVRLKMNKTVRVRVRATESGAKVTHPNQCVGTIAEYLPLYKREAGPDGKPKKKHIGEKMIRAYQVVYKKDKLTLVEVA